MAAIVDEANDLDFDKLSAGIIKKLPAYARPMFLRIIKTPVSLTGLYLLLCKFHTDIYCTMDHTFRYIQNEKK